LVHVPTILGLPYYYLKYTLGQLIQQIVLLSRIKATSITNGTIKEVYKNLLKYISGKFLHKQFDEFVNIAFPLLLSGFSYSQCIQYSLFIRDVWMYGRDHSGPFHNIFKYWYNCQSIRIDTMISRYVPLLFCDILDSIGLLAKSYILNHASGKWSLVNVICIYWISCLIDWQNNVYWYAITSLTTVT
jgi:hypothetical protein